MDFNAVECAKEYYQKYKVVERKFASDLVSELGGNAEVVTGEDDYLNHVDVWWRREGMKRRVSFDVKAMRKSKRSDSDFDDTITWLELVNVKGEPGSLCSDVDYLAFETKEEWVIVRRKLLMEKTLEEIKDDTVFYDTPSGFFQKYQRKKFGRKDIIVKVPIDFIRKHAGKTIAKS